MHSRAHDRIFEKISARTHGCHEEAQLSTGWILIGLELSSPNFNSSVRAERLFMIRYCNIAIKPLCGNLDISVDIQSWNPVRVLSLAMAADRDCK